MKWSVIKFPEENTVEVVPTSWYINESKECFWPPRDIKRYRIVSLIRNCEDPEPQWKIYNAELLEQYNDLEIAQKKVKKAEVTSDLSSNNELGRGYRPKKKSIKYQSISTDEDVSSEDDNIYPRMKVFSTSAVVHSDLNENGQYVHQLKTSNQESNSTRSLTSTRILTSTQSTMTEISLFEDDINKEGFKNMTIQELSLINIKLDSLMDKVATIAKCITYNSFNVLPLTDKNLEAFQRMIPIQNEEAMDEMENWLKDKSNYKIMLMELTRIGGEGVAQCVRKILYRVIDNEVAKNYSWDGARQKKAFKQTKLSNAILEAVKSQHRDTTETEIINVIKVWLVKAKERIKQKEKHAGNSQETLSKSPE